MTILMVRLPPPLPPPQLYTHTNANKRKNRGNRDGIETTNEITITSLSTDEESKNGSEEKEGFYDADQTRGALTALMNMTLPAAQVTLIYDLEHLFLIWNIQITR
jgi:hypothetical protein